MKLTKNTGAKMAMIMARHENKAFWASIIRRWIRSIKEEAHD